MFLITLALAAFVGPAHQLEVRIPPVFSTAPSSVIVGRAVCHGTTWLLHESSELTAYEGRGLRPAGRAPVAVSDRVWGLACTGEGLATLATPWELMTFRVEGGQPRRTRLASPFVALFDRGPGWVGQPLRPSNATILVSGLETLDAPAPFAGLEYRRSSSRETELRLNLVSCGLGLGTAVPCWFADQATFTVSDGERSTVRPVTPRLQDGSDRQRQILDVALSGRAEWVLLRGDGDSQRGGAWLGHQHGDTGEWVQLPSRARLILRATESHCVLLTTSGALIEVARS